MRILFLNQAPHSIHNEVSAYESRVAPLLQSYASPGTTVELGYPDHYPGEVVSARASQQQIQTELPQTIATPALVQKAVWAAANGYDAVIQSHTLDPGVEASRLVVRIPVIGLFRTALLVASSIAERVAVTVPFDHYEIWARRMLRAYRMEYLVTDIRSFRLPGVQGAAEKKDEITAIAAETMRKLVAETRAECVLPVGGLLIPYLIDPADLERAVGVPVLNLKAIGIRYAEMCVQLGLSHSPATYPVLNLHAEDLVGLQ